MVKLPWRERKGQWPRGGAEVAPVVQGRGWQAGTSSSSSSEYCAALSCERMITTHTHTRPVPGLLSS